VRHARVDRPVFVIYNPAKAHSASSQPPMPTTDGREGRVLSQDNTELRRPLPCPTNVLREGCPALSRPRGCGRSPISAGELGILNEWL